MIRLRVIPDPYIPDTSRVIRDMVQPGDMWRYPLMDNQDRDAWAIVLPNRTVWYTTQTVRGKMWDVTGQPPHITVNPSIWDQDPENGWHGWIRDGLLVEA